MGPIGNAAESRTVAADFYLVADEFSSFTRVTGVVYSSESAARCLSFVLGAELSENVMYGGFGLLPMSAMEVLG